MHIIADREEIATSLPGEDRWVNSWHPPTAAPDGEPHGAAGVCVTPDGGALLVSLDGER